MDLERYFGEVGDRDWDAPAADGRIRYAVVGCGWFAEEFALPAIAAGTYCEAAVLVTSSPETGRELADRYDVETVIDYGAFHDGAATGEYDAAYVATPNATHLEHVEAAADLGKDVLCEKPLEVDAERTAALVEACSAAGVTLMTAYRQQAEPVVRRLRDVVRDGVIGTPVYAIGNFSITLLGREADVEQWRLDRSMAGGGALVDIGIYPLNTLRFVLGEDPVAVRAETKTTDERYGDVEEHVSFQLSFPGATTATFASSYGASQDDRFVLVGTAGTVALDPAFFPEVERTVSVERDGVSVTLGGGDVSGIAEEFDYFAHCLLTGRDPEPDGADGLVDARAIDAIYESAETGRRVEL